MISKIKPNTGHSNKNTKTKETSLFVSKPWPARSETVRDDNCIDRKLLAKLC